MTERCAQRPLARVLLLFSLATLTSSCATPNADPADPWERMNRGTFAFNMAADEWVIEPVAKGWDFVLPDFVETGISNFFENLRMPRYVLNNMLQGRIEDAIFEVFRFGLNATFGIGGFIDVAAYSHWPHFPEDFNLTMGHWGVPSGPYLVLPIFGPSTVRGTGGLAVDSMTNPYTYFVPFYVPIAATATDMLNTRAIFLEEVQQSREEAFDFYVFVRSAYLQNVEHRLYGTSTADEPDEDLYYFEDELEDEDAPQERE
jgi:phospholipid-binding lipoprotein MlaA